tara:strand:+ start:72 stop:818 length:747 start_codon:yes stop_codon:yes gene_type:complete
MTPFNLISKLIIFPIYYVFHYNILFGYIQKKIIKDFNYKKFKFSLKGCNFPLPYYSSFIFNTYELNDRKIIEKNLSKKNKCIIIGGGIGFIGVLSYHLTKNPIIIFEINKSIILNLKKNLKKNFVKYKIFLGNLLLNKKYQQNYFFQNKNFLATSMYRSSAHKKKLKNLNYKKIKILKKFNTLIIDGEGVEEHYINNISKLPNIKYLIFEFHYDIFSDKKKEILFNKLRKNRFYKKDRFINSYFFEKN